MTMPFSICELSFQETTRKYKVYPNGSSVVASTEDLQVWDHVQELEKKLAATEEPSDQSPAANEPAAKPTKSTRR